ncbi:matrixin family metalloprotease [Streptomyces bobili]
MLDEVVAVAAVDPHFADAGVFALSPGVVATTCSWSRSVKGGGPDRLKEADVRFNTRHYTFTSNPTGDCKNAYDIGSVATHEAGHVFGLAHVGSGHEGQIMFTNSFACSTSAAAWGAATCSGCVPCTELRSDRRSPGVRRSMVRSRSGRCLPHLK